MRHNLRFSKTACIGLAFCTVMIAIPSCIDELYDLKNGLSSEMALGGDSLAMRIGSTDTIRLSDFLNEDDIAMLKTMEDGGYSLSMKDSINVDIPKIDQKSLTIADKTLSKSQPVSFGDINLANFKIPGSTINKDFSLSLNSISLNSGNFSIPSLSQDTSFAVGMSDYALGTLAVPSKNVEASKEHIFAGINLPPIPPVGTAELTIRDTSISFNIPPASFTNTIEIPHDVTGIDTIYLKSGAKFDVSIELEGADDLFSNNEATIVPNISIDPSTLFLFAGGEGHPIIFNTSAQANNFYQSKSYDIDAFKIEENELGDGQISISRNIQVEGSMALRDAKIMSDRVSELDGLKFVMKVSVNGVEIKSMKFDIPKITTDLSGAKYFGIKNSIPAEVDSIKDIYFLENPASISFELKTPDLPKMENGKIKISQLDITFPEGFVLKPGTAVDRQTYTLKDVEFTPGENYPVNIELSKLNLSKKKIENGYLNWRDSVYYSGNMSLTGRIDSKDLSASQDARMGIALATSLSFKSATVVTKDILKEIDPSDSIAISLDIDIADQVKRLSTVALTPGRKIHIDIHQPELPLALAGDNLKIIFPDLFVFKSDLPSLKPDMGNFYLINGTIPPFIELELDSLNINQDLTDGVLNLKKGIKVSGGVKLLAGEVSSTAINELTDKKLSLKAEIQDLTIASTSIQLKTLESSDYADSTNLDIENNDIPKEIVSLDSIILDNNAYMDLSMEITNMPNLTSPLMADMVLDFPDLLMFSEQSIKTQNMDIDSKNRLTINEAFKRELDKTTLHKRIGIKGLAFDNHILNRVLEIHEKVKFNVKIKVENPTVNSSELNGQDIKVFVEVKLSGIKFKSVYGRINPNIAPQTTNVSLSDIPDFLKGDSVTLDLTRPVIKLKTQSNLEIPINIKMTLTPKRNGSELKNDTLSIPLKLPKAIAGVNKDSYFWIGPDSTGIPPEYIPIDSDIQLLFKKVPDDIKLVVDAQADMGQQHHIDLNTDYKMKVNYDVVIPMAFGEDLNIEIRDTISDLDEAVGEIAFSGKSLEVFGIIQNSIPLQLDFTLTPLDKDNKIINVTAPTQRIESGDSNGGATSTTLSLKFNNKDGLLKNVRGFELKYRASSNGTAAGTPIRPENFVKADLKVRLEGGIKIGDK